MANNKTRAKLSAQPRLHQRAAEIQAYGSVDKHYEEQVELVDSIAERIQLLAGVGIAMAADVADVA